ncbi:MAG: hypothetical protein JWM73_1531 [Solirubrobacterales bacterium]|nr:hypothetical protein [Solirubrobacterales bacterium]
MTLRIGPAVLALSLLLAGSASASDPAYTTVKLPGSAGGQEPRIAVGPDDVRYAVAVAADGNETVWRSRDQGQTWQKVEGLPPQEAATIDVDVVTMPTGRILASELDDGGLNFPTGYSDDGGRTWTRSLGSNMLADQDRQWFAVGPVPKGAKPGTQPPVYLLYHNLASGVAQHNMFVATSNDGGGTFGPPVPIAQPGSDAYLDLQCSDSGGPSNITVNPKTGRVYAFYTTRASPTPAGADAGGCGAPVFGQPVEFNIVNGTRVWVASSKDGSPGSWTNSLAVDDSATGQVVSMQLAYGALDNTGRVYVAYPESPHPYPNLEGAGIKLTWQTPDAAGLLADKLWSKPSTLVAPDPADKIVGGADLVHLVAGDPGKIAVAYYHGASSTKAATPFYSHILQSFDALSPAPHVIDKQVSDVPAYNWSVSGMMGLCDTSKQVGPLQGVFAGLGCDRSTDVWGIALDARCNVMSTWTSASKSSDGATTDLPGSDPATFVTTQTGGPTLCATPASLPGGSQGVVYQPPPGAALPSTTGSGTGGSSGGTACVDRVRPGSRVAGKVRASRTRLRVHGAAIDHGCGVKGKRARRRIRSVAVAVGLRTSTRGCRYLHGDGTLGSEVACKHPTFVLAEGGAAWSLAVKGRLPRGRYILWTRAIDVAGNAQRKPRSRHLTRFRIR